ncbi:MAG: DUF4350 domain-containing protein [Kiritimatiellia bacterium]
MTRTVRVIFARTVGRLWPSFSTAVCVAGFLALSGAFFTHALVRGDGGTTPVEALWATAAVPFLPVLAALVTMRLVADERANGRLELLLSAPLLEREIVLGKYLGAFALCALALALYLVVPVVLLPLCAPALRGALSLFSFLPAMLALLLQSALWCAVGLLASACSRHAAVAAFASMILVLALPHAAFEMATAWSPVLRMRFASMPFEAHIVDFATGLVRLSTLAFYGVLILFALFAATKAVAAVRLRGRGARGLRCSTLAVTVLAFVFASLVVTLTLNLDFTFELPLHSGTAKTSARTRQILSETHGDVHVTCFLARRAPEFRAVSRLLRGLEATARSVAGARLSVEYVDPRWELGRAVELVRKGAEEGTLVFRRGSRKIQVPVKDLFSSATNGVVAVGESGLFVGETACASALQRLSLPARRETVYWTVGHGETSYTSYDAVAGMSDIARELRRDGYHLGELDLTASPVIPEDAAVLVVAGAREPFSRVETTRLEGWMRAGGRLLVLATQGPNAGVGALLANLGVKVLPYAVVSPRTLSGSDVVVRDFSDHPVTRPLMGGTAVFADAVALVAVPSSQVEGTVYTELARTDERAWGESDLSVRPWTRDATFEPGGPLALAVALERGGDVAKDVALHPMRLVVLGDAAFVSNGALALRGNANREIFLNSLAWLAGLDALTASRAPGNAVATGMDREGWIRFGFIAVLGPSLFVVLVGLLLWPLRRRGA